VVEVVPETTLPAEPVVAEMAQLLEQQTLAVAVAVARLQALVLVALEL
jgi:hypothetical protein